MPKILEQILLTAFYVIATSSALITLKLGSKGGAPIQIADGKLAFNLSPAVLAGIALYGVGFVLYAYLISKYDLGYIIPLTTALVYIVIFTASFFIFNEVFTITKILGISLILLGLLLLNVNGNKLI